MNPYVYSPEYNIWSREQDHSFSYSDGIEIEEYLYRTVQSCSDKSVHSEELIQHIVDWPSRYHFSPVRHNLLRPFKLSSGMKVLEIGCGCGTMTRYLGEAGCSVIAVEGSKQRAKIAAERNRDLNNVSIFCDNFENFQYPEKFDIVTLIGVLEYAPAFISSNQPVESFLRQAREFLKPDGALIIAIENQLGLKYFNGASEDHTGGIFDGINDFYRSKGVVTFGKKDLESRLTDSGFEKCQFLYPFPDYKIPTFVVNDNAFREPLFDVAQIIGQYPSEDYSGQRSKLFYEERSWGVLARNGLAQDLSNSFLIIAGFLQTEEMVEGNWLASSYSVQRRKEYATETLFYANDSDHISVLKRKLFKNEPLDESLEHRLGEFPYISGNVYGKDLPEVFRAQDVLQEFISFCRPWVDFLDLHQTDGRLPGSFLDCTPMNLIKKHDGSLEYIDAEWSTRQELPLNYVFFRGLANLVSKLEPHDKSKLLKDLSMSEFIIELAKHFHVPLSRQALNDFIVKEAELHDKIYVKGKGDYSKTLQKWLDQPTPASRSPVELVDSRNMVVQQLEQHYNLALDHAKQEIDALKQELGGMIQSRSWRMTKGLRDGTEVLRKVKRRMRNTAKRIRDLYRLQKNKMNKAKDCERNLREGISYSLFISHTDYLISMGGTEKCILENIAYKESCGEGSIVVFPAERQEFMGSHRGSLFGIYIDGQKQGYLSLNALLSFLKRVSAHIGSVQIHHLLFWQYSDYRELHQVLKSADKEIVYYAHDFFACCTSYHMIQETQFGTRPCINKIMSSNNIEAVCGECKFGQTADERRAVFREILTDCRRIVLPSEFVKDTFLAIYPEFTEKFEVVPHLRLIKADPGMSASKDRKLKVAYLGYKMNNKGWITWEKLINDPSIHTQYDLYHLGSDEAYSRNVKCYSYSFVEHGVMAAVDLLVRLEIDVVILWSVVPESYSYTLQEARAAGSYILTSSWSGNIAYTIEQCGSECGLVLQSEEQLFNLLRDVSRFRSLMPKTRERYTLVPNVKER